MPNVLTLIRPTVETPFHIDWNWFARNDIDGEQVLRDQLTPDVRQEFEQGKEIEDVDWIDPDTGEVFRVDSLREAILSECQWKPNYITESTPLITAVFRALLANNNRPTTPVELAQRLGRSTPETILNVLSRGGVKYGIVPTEK